MFGLAIIFESVSVGVFNNFKRGGLVLGVAGVIGCGVSTILASSYASPSLRKVCFLRPLSWEAW